MPLARASELDRLFACAGSAVLERDAPRPIGPAAQWGNLVHYWAETGGFTDLTDPKDRAAVEERVRLAGVDREALWPSGGYREVALALNVTTGESRTLADVSLLERDEWKASFDDHWVVGTADYCGEIMDLPWVDDLKTGRFAAWEDYAAQQTFYALAYTRARYGATHDTRTTITHWPKYPKARPPHRAGRVLDVGALNGFAARLSRLRESILRGREQPENFELDLGRQCLYCPSKGQCPKLKEVENGKPQV